MQPVDIAQIIRHAQGRIRVLGGGTKAGLALPEGEGVTTLSTAELTGITEYDPSEYTVTALAGTKLRDLNAALGASGQYLPFDPLLADAGATVGGTVAANASGPGKYRFGGVRDFIIGVQFVDGTGRLVRGGGKVVKNAAGFDFPKLLTGSAGRLGVITEVTFKVFPRPAAWMTASVNCADLADALKLASLLRVKPFDLDALEIEADGQVIIRLGGDEAALTQRLSRISATTGCEFRPWKKEDAATWWHERTHPMPKDGWWRLRIPVIPDQVAAVSAILTQHGAKHQFSAGGNLASVLWPEASPISVLPWAFQNLDAEQAEPDNPFYRHIKGALDPQGRFSSAVAR